MIKISSRLRIAEESIQSCIIFMKSVESTHRLARLLEIISGLSRLRSQNILEFSSAISSQRRADIATRVAKRGEKTEKVVMVCSDVMARGMDIPSVDLVINYDIPVHITTYLHRVGRTARAGQRGTSLSILCNEQVRYFKAMMKRAARSSPAPKVHDVRESWISEDPAMERLRQVLSILREVLIQEKRGWIDPLHPLPSHVLVDISQQCRGRSHSPHDTLENILDDQFAIQHQNGSALEILRGFVGRNWNIQS